MFSSPCSFRSAQCAALIALAAAAGISRVEATAKAPIGEHNGRSTEQTPDWNLGESKLAFFQLDRAALAPWTQRFVAFAFRFFVGRSTAPESRAAAAAVSSDAQHDRHAPHSAAAEHGSVASTSLVTAPAVSAIAYFDAPRPALCTRERLLPFAVGPPAGDAHSNPDAGDTEVSCNTTARGLTNVAASIASLAGVLADARLARLSPKRDFAGPTLPSATAGCGARISSPPPFGAAASTTTTALPRPCAV